MGISLGLVGLGAFGSAFARLFKSHPAVDRIGLCDREPDRIAKFANNPSFEDKFNAKDTYNSLDEILKSDFDALVIITQPWLHAEQAVQAMEAGKHVYSAVPLVSLPDSDEILDWCAKLVNTCKKTGMHYMLGETTYYRPQAMFCRRKAAEGAFGDFVYAEGEYFHDVDHGLREVSRHRLGSTSGQEWVKKAATYRERGVISGPMHYPTHSTSGPICVMKAHAVKVSGFARYSKSGDPWFGKSPSDESALFLMSNDTTMRICEFREIGHRGREMFRVYGSQGSFEHDTWCDKKSATALSANEMRDPLPPEVAAAMQAGHRDRVEGAVKLSEQEKKDFLGGHGGSHAYLVHEFVDAIAHERTPAINAWESARYMAAGATAHKSGLKDGERLDVPDWGDAPS